MHPFTSPVFPILSLLIVVPLIAFWVWMFRDMLDTDGLPSLVSRDAKSDWTFAFIFLNVFAAVLYYTQIYRNKR
jgi:hypothetical protein